MENRKSNFELLRIVSMFFIIIWHVIMHGKMLDNCHNETITILMTIVQYIIVVHVNSFILVTGYFQSKSKFKIEKLIKLILQVIFYSSIIYLLSIKLKLVNDFNYLNIFDKINLNALGDYWFIKTYIIIYIFSDYINKFIDCLNKRQLYKFLIIGFLIFSIIPVISRSILLYNDGYNFFHFIYIYIIGATLRKYPLKENYYFKNFTINQYKCIVLFIFILFSYLNYSFMIVGNNFGDYGSLSTYIKSVMTHNSLGYSNPFIIIQSIAFFELFNTIEIKNRLINYLSKYVFGIYLFHDNPIVRKNIYVFLKIDQPFNNSIMFIYIFLVAIIIFIFGIFIDIIRDKIFITVGRIINKFKTSK